MGEEKLTLCPPKRRSKSDFTTPREVRMLEDPLPMKEQQTSRLMERSFGG